MSRILYTDIDSSYLFLGYIMGEINIEMLSIIWIILNQAINIPKLLAKFDKWEVTIRSVIVQLKTGSNALKEEICRQVFRPSVVYLKGLKQKVEMNLTIRTRRLS